ncbi:hypothetical protein [Streptomyces sp. NPDC026659]|uniref:hypothetical protein n=1 Tax=Streptomyces sp. NPDC026659 TaxID=3155123 RepID=UPI0033DF4B22
MAGERVLRALRAFFGGGAAMLVCHGLCCGGVLLLGGHGSRGGFGIGFQPGRTMVCWT